MAFWGLEVKPSAPSARDPPRSRLRITQAVLGNDQFGLSVLQCDTGNCGPVRICALNPKISPACHLELELEADENVVFSVIGQSSIHLSGYYIDSNNGNHGHYTEKSTRAVGSTCFDKKHQDICETTMIEEKRNDQMAQQQGVHINIKDVEPSHNSDHGCSKEWGIHGNDTDDGNDKNNPMFGSSSCRKTEVCLEKPTESKDDDGELPLVDASVRRTAADGEKVHTEKEKLNTPEIEDVLNYQNGAVGQVNGQICSKIMESNAMDDAKTTQCHKNSLEGNDLHTGCQEQNVSQSKEHNVVAEQITNQNAPLITTFDEGYTFTGAVENDVEQPNEEAENHIQLLDNGMTIEDVARGNTNAKIASNGKKVRVRFSGRLMNGDVFDPTDLEDTYTFVLGAGKVIRGVELGIDGMRVGGKRRLRIPPALGFGDVAVRNIPANSWLLYDIELLKVKRAKRAR